MVAAAVLMALLMLLVFGLIASLRRSTGMSARGSVELAAATELAERFRLDVRQAASARIVDAKGEALELSGVAQIEASGLLLRPGEHLEPAGGSAVRYALDEDGRIARFVDGVRTHGGPKVYAASFALKQDASGQRLVEARWRCAADLAGEPIPDGLPAPAGIVLVLDTALNVDPEVAP
ncbi:MAG: hypothetical protein KIS92_24125 [Planctomycetota bacterium]|nr:hypothetical protein [Planctomycetota bacterium]